MLSINWIQQLRQWLNRQPGRRARRHLRRRRLRNSPLIAVEPLEDRTLLSTIAVTALTDGTLESLAGDGQISLREAVEAANTDTSVDGSTTGSGADTIVFDAGLAGGTITLSGTELMVYEDLTIGGLGANLLTISGNDTSRVFAIGAGVTAKIADVSIVHGSAADGGGIYNEGTLTVENTTLTDNTAVTDGGAIDNLGELTVVNSTIKDNWATYGGGIVSWSLLIDSPKLSVTGSTISGNYADYQGGGIWSDGTVNINDSTIAENDSYSTGGGIYTIGALEVYRSKFSANTTGGNGAGIFTRDGGTVKVRETDFIGNTSGSAGGAIDNAGGFFYNNPGSLDIADSTFIGNAASSGAGIWNEGPAIVASSTFVDNHVRNWGGAIANNINLMTIVSSTFTDNSAGAFSGAVDNSFGGDMVIEGSLFTRNHAGREGGAIEQFFGTLKIVNTTISQNTSDGTGGGIWNLGKLEITNATIVLNQSDADDNGSGSGGGLYHDHRDDYPDPLINNTILAGNVRGAAATPDDIFGDLDFTSAHNLIGDVATAGGLIHGANGNIVGNSGAGTIDLSTVLDTTLRDNGGLTLTHALIPGGLAVDRGSNALANGLTDQAGSPRILDGNGDGIATVDIGAVELVTTDGLFTYLKQQVSHLGDVGLLKMGEEKSLYMLLTQSENQYDGDNLVGSIHLLETFVLRIHKLVDLGVLSAKQAESLTSTAESILNGLNADLLEASTE